MRNGACQVNSQFEATTVQHSDHEAGSANLSGPRIWVLRWLWQVEPAVGGSIGIAMGWLATSSPDLPVLWLFSIVALAVGCWAWVRAAQQQIEVGVRALILLTAAAVLQTSGGAAGSGVFFYWVAITALYYAFILRASAGGVVAVAAVVEVILASLWGGPDTLGNRSTGVAVLMILPLLLVMKLGALARRPSEQLETARTDCSTLLYNRSGLMAHGQALLASCRGEGRELTLAVFDCNDLLEARQIYGNRTSRKLIACIIAKMTSLAGERGLAARTGPTQFAVAMPMGRDKALQAIGRVLGNPGRIELEGGNSEIVLVPNLMAESVSQTGSLERLFAALCRGLARVRDDEQQRNRYLQRERERHSRPMPVQAAAFEVQHFKAVPVPRLGPDPVVSHQIPTTIPMPLPMR